MLTHFDHPISRAVLCLSENMRTTAKYDCMTYLYAVKREIMLDFLGWCSESFK